MADGEIVTTALADVIRLYEGLEDALEGMESMIDYCPEYFQDKWDLRGYIERARQTLALETPTRPEGGSMSPSFTFKGRWSGAGTPDPDRNTRP